MKDQELMNELMEAISQTKTWERIEIEDSLTKAADKRHTAVLSKIQNLIPAEIYSELEDANLNYIFAVKDSAILYGIHVADALRGMTENPEDLSRYVVDQWENRR